MSSKLRPIRFPNDIDQFIQAKAEKEALLKGTNPMFSRGLFSWIRQTKDFKQFIKSK